MTQAHPTAPKRVHYHGTIRVSYYDKSYANKQKQTVTNPARFELCSGFGLCVSAGTMGYVTQWSRFLTSESSCEIFEDTVPLIILMNLMVSRCE